MGWSDKAHKWNDKWDQRDWKHGHGVSRWLPRIVGLVLMIVVISTLFRFGWFIIPAFFILPWMFKGSKHGWGSSHRKHNERYHYDYENMDEADYNEKPKNDEKPKRMSRDFPDVEII
ncbi:MAG: hypothetical protein H7Y11_13060 [Armatimonadetes bacterium]|nr:hypothetical protein [Anaerolineae bacterium]